MLKGGAHMNRTAAIIAISMSMAATFAQSAPAPNLLGGAKGVVKTATGEPLEGIMVQLISKETAIRTTVYSDRDESRARASFSLSSKRM
jgi:hypothetical protein